MGLDEDLTRFFRDYLAACGIANGHIACEHAFVTSQGHAYPRFKRALRSGNATLAWAAAVEVGRLALDDALALCLLELGVEGGRYDAAAVRWHSRFCAEMRGVTTGEAQLLLAALGSLPSKRPQAAVATLISLLDRYGLDTCAAVVDEWAERAGFA